MHLILKAFKITISKEQRLIWKESANTSCYEYHNFEFSRYTGELNGKNL